ncbi:DEAD/DEAH box helicase [Tessaracoccus sp. SD287]|uniref:DEAD/DEAH box helicase n=1 Tax=Tessaracoccus sp. SD287 TaxID=2782008 RepID=UPI001A975A2A|nr:DEAD/DEAH box helicase [Tessaracoccus sp. SD287]MBO1029903.1 DEAD/DEAH box helicase [Tessaracoccus sp. SD287]
MYSFSLDEYQVQACAHVEAGHGVLVAAPTGSGKTVVGEFAVFCALEQRTKCFYTTPIKALSNQKFHDLVARHGAENVGLLTGDTSINGEAPIVVMTTEVLRNMIYADSRTLHNLGYVVMDEVHYLADRFRGAVWEEVILGLAERVQLVSLSATVSNAEEFGDWLDEVRGNIHVVLSERRPVPLYQHVLAGRTLHDLFSGDAPTAVALPSKVAPEVNPDLVQLARTEARGQRDDSRRPRGRSGKGKRPTHGSGRYGGAASALDGRGRERDEQGPRLVPSRWSAIITLERANLLPAIVFVFSRAGCDGAVRQLVGSGARLTTPSEAARLARIATKHVGGLSPHDRQVLDYDFFLDALQRGIAAHHAGILPAFKAIVEEGFAEGLIKVVYATETLALGINMPARTVMIEKLVKYNGEAHVDITPGEYTQLTGRAGRRGIDVEGHAVVVWSPGMDPRAVAGLASRRTYPLKSSFTPTYNMAVNLVGRMGREAARGMLEQSFAQFQTDRSVVGLARTASRDAEAIEQYLAAAACDRGDFGEYARLREQISELEAEQARGRRRDFRVEVEESLRRLEPGDIIWVTGGRHLGWAAVIDGGVGRDRDPHPMVMTIERELVRLTFKDFPTPTTKVGKLRIPRKFDPRKAPMRKALAASLHHRLNELDPSVPQPVLSRPDEQILDEIAALRATLRSHPCHGCPDRESHARFAERAMRLEREHTRAQTALARRTNTIAATFDKICGVLTSLGYLDADDPDQVTPEGRMLARIYSELDLVAAEAIRTGIFDELDVPQLAAVLSSLVYEARRTDQGRMSRMPDAASEQAQSALRAVWRDVGLVERDNKLERGPEPDIGFAEAAYAWADGQPLAEVLFSAQLPAGDFVRWVRQVADMAGQVAVAAGMRADLAHQQGAAPGPADDLARRCRTVVDMMRRGVVDFDPDED